MPMGRSRPIHLAVLCLEWPSVSRHVGGVGRYAFRLTGWLSGHVRVSVVTGPDPEPMAGVDLYPMEAAHFSDRMKRYYVAPISAAKVVRDLEPDVVHSHGDDAVLAWGRRPPPIIRTYYGRAAGEARSGRWQRQANHVALAAIEHSARRRYAKAVAIGPDSAAAYRTDTLIPPVLPQDLPKGVGARSAQPTVVFIGGFGGRKRGWLVVDVVGRSRLRCDAITLVVFGPEADRSCYPAWVDFRAGATDAEVRAALAEAWLLLAPSTYEGFGIPAWEAMGSGAVVIGSPSPGLTFLAGGAAAAVVSDAALAPTLISLVGDEAERRSMAARGRLRAEEIARMADPGRYLDLVREVA
jgi:glycosyltransferase involved in cell wall biosynthesis